MVRTILGIIAGVVVGVIVVMLVEGLGHMMFPPPAGLDPSDPEAMKAIIANLSFGAFASVLAAWGLGTLAGGFTAARIARNGEWPAWVVAPFVLASAIYEMMRFSHPVWFMGSALAICLGMGWLAGRLGTGRSVVGKDAA